MLVVIGLNYKNEIISSKMYIHQINALKNKEEKFDRIFNAATLCPLLARVYSLRGFCLISQNIILFFKIIICFTISFVSINLPIQHLGLFAGPHCLLASLLQLQSLVVVRFGVAFLKVGYHWFVLHF